MLFTGGAGEGYVNTGRIRDLSITRNGGADLSFVCLVAMTHRLFTEFIALLLNIIARNSTVLKGTRSFMTDLFHKV